MKKLTIFIVSTYRGKYDEMQEVILGVFNDAAKAQACKDNYLTVLYPELKRKGNLSEYDDDAYIENFPLNQNMPLL